MGKAPKNVKPDNGRKPARIVSFSDAKRASGRSAAPTTRKPPKSGAKTSFQARKSSKKEFTIARGDVRSGALPMLAEEEIEARAAAEQNRLKQEKKQKSRIYAFNEERKKRSEAKQRARKKVKAEKQFEKTYGAGAPGSSAAQAAQAAESAGPRAAVYEGKMGSSHKKSSKMQMKGAGNVLKGMGSKVSVPKIKLSDFTKRLGRVVAVVAVFALFAVMLYGPAQQYYQQMRETDRLQAEYAAVATRTDALQSTIDTLSSEEGIEDKAHTDLGYVKKNEESATVKGLNLVNETEFTSNVAPGSVPAPDTWYSPVLDILFDYSG